MDWQRIIELLIAGGAAGLIGAVTVLWKTRRDAVRDDRKLRADESTGAATAAKSITDATATLVKLADEQVEEFKQQIRALQAESSALGTRLDREIEKRLRSEAKVQVLEDEISKQREALAAMGAQFEMADQERQELRRENGAMKTKLFEWSVGIAALMRQVKEFGAVPVYTMDIPVQSGASGKLGAINADAVTRYSS